MSDTDRTEAALLGDLATLGDRLADEQFCTELYRALAGGHLTKDGGAVAPSWGNAENAINRLRAQVGAGEPLTLAQTGGEGELSGDVQRALDERGWRWRPRDPSVHDTAHAGRPEAPPPPDAGKRAAPVSPSDEWERTAHEEAERSRFRRPDAPAQAGPGTGAGGGEGRRVGGS
jgi:hypothetical protein